MVPSCASARIVPCCSTTNCLVMASPKPLPPASRCRGRIGAPEAVKEMCQFIRRQFAGICDDKLNLLAISPFTCPFTRSPNRSRCNGNLAAWGRVAQGIGQQVVEHLLCSVGVNVDVRQRRRDVIFDGDFRILRQGRKARDDGLH